MARCEDYPCCGHTDIDPCDYAGPSSSDILADPARYHLGCDHETGYCEYESYDEDDEWEDDSLSDVEADAATLASAGWGTDEDYGYYGDES